MKVQKYRNCCNCYYDLKKWKKKTVVWAKMIVCPACWYYNKP